MAAPCRTRAESARPDTRSAHRWAVPSEKRSWWELGGAPKPEDRYAVSSSVSRMPASSAAAISAAPIALGSAYGVPPGAWCT
ncbi:hypothetical protein SSPIM334S_02066 [Streptomyces spiroverticillatus]